MKTFLKHAIRNVAKRLLHFLPPASRAMVVRDAVPIDNLVDNLPKKLLQDVLFGAAKSLGVTALRVKGRLGEIEGSPRDQVILFRYLQTGTWSGKFQDEIIDNVFHLGKGTYIDVGANIGLTTIPVASKWQISCYAFEPDPTNFRFLQRNVELNGVSQKVQLFNIAAHDCETTLDFELSPENFGDHRVRAAAGATAIPPKQGEDTRQTIKVTASPLDTALSGIAIQHPLVLKIDVQGAEAMVFRGAKSLLSEADCLVVEFSPYALARAGVSEDDFLPGLQGFSHGFITSFDSNDDAPRLSSLKPLTLEEIVAKCRSVSSNKHPDNYFDLVLLKNPDFLRVDA